VPCDLTAAPWALESNGLALHGTDDALAVAHLSFETPHTVIDRLDDQLKLQRTALNMRAYRQELLASNIANADTPNFKARDVDFKSALEGAMKGQLTGGLEVARTSSRHLKGEDSGAFAGSVKYRTEFQPNADGNTVNMDIERSAFAENAIHMEATLTFIRGQFQTMSTALQSQ
jgi:flagellar basal-body rod protein FlgB